MIFFNGNFGYFSFVLNPVGDIGGAVCPEINYVMHWVVVWTPGACCDMRLSIRRRSCGPWTPREPDARPWTVIENQPKPCIFNGFDDFHWFSLIFKGFQWFLMIFDDIDKTCRSSRRSAWPPRPARRPHACRSVPYWSPQPLNASRNRSRGPPAAPKSLTIAGQKKRTFYYGNLL